MVWLDYLLRAGSELTRREALLCPFWGLLIQTTFVIDGSPLNGLLLVPPQLWGLQCFLTSPLRCVAGSWRRLPSPQNVYLWSTWLLACPEQNCQLRLLSPAQWYNRSEMLALRHGAKEKRKEGKNFIIIKTKVLTWHTFGPSWGKQAQKKATGSMESIRVAASWIDFDQNLTGWW